MRCRSGRLPSSLARGVRSQLVLEPGSRDVDLSRPEEASVELTLRSS